ncbi:DUF4326 domain-containing protein [Micromonospora sp. WMMD718]|uniref:DUF4326 domain-containing protein n=1 Tax=unclassified Micromonospora TaxID=2617518 RepID=UPI00064C3A8B|nr:MULTISPECIES: DUF4326 domain-containing protein [unclassified Micromonospora]MDG4753791.1 DUF4326 domain-containing protein [Micromonospora sp. WMMD718]
MTARRIQRRRRAGWRMPAGAVYVGRPTRWGNPFVRSTSGEGRAEAIRLFRRWVAEHQEYAAAVRVELAGKTLACWCPLDEPCHADELLRIANEVPQ